MLFVVGVMTRCRPKCWNIYDLAGALTIGAYVLKCFPVWPQQSGGGPSSVAASTGLFWLRFVFVEFARQARLSTGFVFPRLCQAYSRSAAILVDELDPGFL